MESSGRVGERKVRPGTGGCTTWWAQRAGAWRKGHAGVRGRPGANPGLFDTGREWEVYSESGGKPPVSCK